MSIGMFRSRKFTDFEGCSNIQDSLLGWSPKELMIVDSFSKFCGFLVVDVVSIHH